MLPYHIKTPHQIAVSFRRLSRRGLPKIRLAISPPDIATTIVIEHDAIGCFIAYSRLPIQNKISILLLTI